MIRITDKAKEKIVSILSEEKSTYLRFGLQGGGCNGFTYFFAVEETLEEDDFQIAIDGSHTLLVDAASNMYLEEAEIDYKKDLMGESFIFNNPNQKTSCGCGSSVSFD
jgi:iron-sulfur cluster assembly accessory protein